MQLLDNSKRKCQCGTTKVSLGLKELRCAKGEQQLLLRFKAMCCRWEILEISLEFQVLYSWVSITSSYRIGRFGARKLVWYEIYYVYRLVLGTYMCHWVFGTPLIQSGFFTPPLSLSCLQLNKKGENHRAWLIGTPLSSTGLVSNKVSVFSHTSLSQGFG